MTRADRLRADGWTECGTCDGRGLVPDLGTDARRSPCPDCVDGRVPPDGMVDAALMVHVNGPPLKDLPSLNLPELRLVTRRALVAAARAGKDQP